jgi:hypothetical protein
VLETFDVLSGKNMGAYLASRCSRTALVSKPKPSSCPSLRLTDGTTTLNLDSILHRGDEGWSEDGGSLKLSTIPDFRTVSVKDPGRLLQMSLQQMAQHLSAHGGSTMDAASLKFLSYLNTIFKAKYSTTAIGPRNNRELVTLAVALDHILAGDAGAAADVLTQRWRAIEMAVAQGGSWEQARHLEITPSDEVSLMSPAEENVLHKRILVMNKLIALRPAR